MKNNLLIKTKHHEDSCDIKSRTTFEFTESGHLILPMKCENEYVSNEEALNLAKFILNNASHTFFRTMENSLKNLRLVLKDYEDEGLKKHNQLYINRIESALRKLQKIEADNPELY